MAKYEKARELKKHIGKVRDDYAAGFKSTDQSLQQRSVAVYLIDRSARAPRRLLAACATPLCAQMCRPARSRGRRAE
eukprot:2078673-Prymnesium_polylepis.1